MKKSTQKPASFLTTMKAVIGIAEKTKLKIGTLHCAIG
jgi:hypothetical protein